MKRRRDLYRSGLSLQFFTWNHSSPGTEKAREGIPKLGTQESHTNISELRPEMLHKKENLQFESRQESYLLTPRKQYSSEKNNRIQNLHNVMFIASRIQLKTCQHTKNQENGTHTPRKKHQQNQMQDEPNLEVTRILKWLL